MGQYYKVVNLDTQEFLYPHDFDSGAKLMEFSSGSDGVMAQVATLLSTQDSGWFGARIVAGGDYADEGKFVEDPALRDGNLYTVASETFKRLSVADLVNRTEKAIVKSQTLKLREDGLRVPKYSSSLPTRFEALYDTANWSKVKLTCFEDFLELIFCSVTYSHKKLIEDIGYGLRSSLLCKGGLMYTIKRFHLPGITAQESAETTVVPVTLGKAYRSYGDQEAETFEMAATLQFPCTVKQALAVFGISPKVFKSTMTKALEDNPA